MSKKTRFAFATVRINSITDGDLEVVRRHTSPVNAKRYAEGRNEEAQAANTGNEYGILNRTLTKNSVFDSATNFTPASVGATKSTKRNGKSRYPVATVTLTKDGNIDELVKLHTSPKNAFHFATGANAEAKGGTEYAVLLRTDKVGGEFPTISSVTTL